MFIKAILSIGDTLQLTSKSKQPTPFNAQGQQIPPPPPPTITTTTSSFNPFMPTQPPTASLKKQESAPFMDPRSLPLPPPLAPTEIRTLPPPPQNASLKRPLPPRTTDSVAPAPKGVPMKQQPVMSKLPAKLPAKVAAKPAPMTTPIAPMSTSKAPMASSIAPMSLSKAPMASSTAPMSTPTPISTGSDQPMAPVRMFPQGAVLSHPPLNSTAGISEQESRAFVEYINTNTAMQQDNDVKPFLPISTNSQQIYSVVSDGWLLW